MARKELRKINQLTRKSYDLAARKYHELFRDELDHKPYDRELLDDFAKQLTPDSIIHDMGCGPSGHIGHYLHAKGLHVIGSDISQNCIDMASACHPDMQFRVMDMTDLPLEDQSVDAIVSYYSIIHTPRDSVTRIFQEFHRVLKTNGKLLLSVKEGNQEGFLEEFLGFRTRIYFTHFRKEEIARFLTGNGFELVCLERRDPLAGEISVPRIFAIGKRRG